MFTELNKIVFSNQFSTKWSIEKLARTWANLDMSLAYLKPELNYLKWMRNYFQRYNFRNIKQIPANLQRGIINIEHSQKQLSEYLTIQHSVARRQALSFQGSTTSIGMMLSALLSFLSLLTLFANLFLIFVFLNQNYPFLFQLYTLLGGQIMKLIIHFPVLEKTEWLFTFLFSLFIYFKLIRLKYFFLEKEINLPSVSA
jgi:hypothetical protein